MNACKLNKQFDKDVIKTTVKLLKCEILFSK